MFSLPELLVIALLAFAVWTTLRRLNRPPASQPRRRPPPRPTPRIEAEDLEACPTCGAYVAQSAGRCGRPGCPRPR
jgi:hypothetical protein